MTEQTGIPGAAGCCQKCSRRTRVHVVGAGSFCATDYLAWVEQTGAVVMPILLEHYGRIAEEETKQ